jgi:hypothetical protein
MVDLGLEDSHDRDLAFPISWSPRGTYGVQGFRTEGAPDRETFEKRGISIDWRQKREGCELTCI